MDPHNQQAMVDAEKEKYWQNVDVYIGGAEHVTRHMDLCKIWQSSFDSDS